MDINEDGYVQYIEWRSFYTLFLENFQNCDKDKNHLLNFDEFKDCLSESTFEDATKEDNSHTSDKEVFSWTALKSLDFKQNQSINIYQYLLLRSDNYAYSKCIKQDESFFYKNFPVAVHLSVRKM